jgi:hypothetical protein
VEQCPVCQTEYMSTQVNYCCNCGWDLRPHLYPFTDISRVQLHVDRDRLSWAREWWTRSQAQIWKLQAKAEKAECEIESLRIELAKSQQERSQLLHRLSEFYAHSFEREKIRTVSSSEVKLAKQETVDLTHLQDLLIQQKWREADLETAVVLLQICDRHTEGWLRISDLENFPSCDLHYIDRLWTNYSKGHFGFSIQQSLWQNLGGTVDASYETWCEFCDLVGWYNQGTWRAYDRLNFSLNAPRGHLPAAYWEMGLGAQRLYYWWWLTPVILFNRFESSQSL